MRVRMAFTVVLLCCAGAARAQSENADAPQDSPAPANGSETSAPAPATDAPAEASAPAANAPATPAVSEVEVHPVDSTGPVAPDAPTQLDAMVVTANKRAESTRTLAGSVTGIGRERLDEAGASSMADYLSLAPGVNFNSGIPGYSVITIRGVSSDTVPGLAQTAVGVYYDDIPLTDPGAPMVVPDIDAFDAERIEVLRGPQGALYGSSSLGGAMNYIPTAPNLFKSAFHVQGTGSLTENSSWGGSGRFMFNTPLFADAVPGGLGLRVVGYTLRTPGWIDNVGTGRDQANQFRGRGGRVTLGWAPTETSTLRVGVLYQGQQQDDTGYVDEKLGDLKKDTVTPEPYSNTLRLYNLHYDQDLDYGSWSLIAGYQQKASHLFYDGASALGVPTAAGVKVNLTQDGTVDGYSVEARFVSPPGETLEWLAGASYANRDENFSVVLNPKALDDAAALFAQLHLDPAALSGATTLFDEYIDLRAPETALFADLTWHVTDTIKLTAGGRYCHNVVDSRPDAKGLLVLPGGHLEIVTHRKDVANGFNPKVSLAWQVTNDVLLYALYSRGYRLGGPNLAPNTAVDPITPNYAPDSVNNYEAGIKSAWLDGKLTADLSAFWIDWSQIPLTVQTRLGLFKYLANAGDARNRGVEGTLAVRPLDFLTLRSTLTWLDARFTEDFDPNNGRPPVQAGDRLPGAAEWTASNSLTGQWLWNNHFPTLTLIHRYVSDSASNLSFQDVRIGGYSTFDLRAGLKLGGFGLNLFGTNLTDSRGSTAANNYALPGSGSVKTLRYISTPRSFGATLDYSFGGS